MPINTVTSIYGNTTSVPVKNDPKSKKNKVGVS